MKKAEQEKLKLLESYFDNSLFHDIIRYPEGSNIAPHNDDFPHYMGFYSGNTYIETTLIQKLQDDKVILKGVFKTNTVKGLKNTEKYCVVTDSGDYSCEMILTSNEVTLSNTVNVSRQIEGKDLDGQTSRDAFFTCLSGDNTKGTITYKEHFVKISNGTRLLHFSEEYEFFEIFELPENWSINKGIENFVMKYTKIFDNGIEFVFDEKMEYPKVFDDIEYDLKDKDLEEVYEILDSRRKINRDSLTKKLR